MWNFSAMNYDMVSPNTWNSMNLHMNQLYDHSIAFPNTFSYPSCNYNNFYPYMNSYASVPMLDPRYTVAQMTWGTPAWGGISDTLGWGGVNFGGGRSNGSSSVSSDDPKEEEYRIKYNKLYNLIKQLKEYEDLDETETAKLRTATNTSSGTWEEKYNKLNKVYKEVKESLGEENFKEFIKETKLKISTDENGNEKSDSASFNEALTAAGYEFSDTEIDTKVSKVFDSIKILKSNTGSATEAEGIVGLYQFESKDILDFISSWNTNNAGEVGSERIITHISSNLPEDSDLKDTVIKHIASPIVNALIDKSRSFNKKILDEASYQKLEDARKELREELTSSINNKEISSGLSDAFDKLYVLTRKAAMAELRYNATKSYSSVDEEFFNNELFVSDVNDDLEKEGFDLDDTDMGLRQNRNDAEEGPDAEDPAAPNGSGDTKKPKETKKQDDAKANGLYLAKTLPGNTESYQHTEINNHLSKLDGNNIMAFLDGYYEDGKMKGKTEGLIERLDDEYDSGTITMTNKKKIITSILAVAKSKGLQNNEHYLALNDLVNKKYKSTTEKTFNHGGWNRFWNGESLGQLGAGVVAGAGAGYATACACSGPVGWIVGAASVIGGVLYSVFDPRTDNEVIDEHLEALYDEIKSLE